MAAGHPGTSKTQTPPSGGSGRAGQPNWASVQNFVNTYLAAHPSAREDVGPAGSPEWCEAPFELRLRAVLEAGSRWVLEEEIRRLHERRDAAKNAAIDVAAAEDWARVAQRIRERDEFRREHPHLAARRGEVA